jgi:hypothetical protein
MPQLAVAASLGPALRPRHQGGVSSRRSFSANFGLTEFQEVRFKSRQEGAGWSHRAPSRVQCRISHKTPASLKRQPVDRAWAFFGASWPTVATESPRKRCAVRRMRPSEEARSIDVRSAGRVFSQWLRPPSPYRSRRTGPTRPARPSFRLSFMGSFADKTFVPSEGPVAPHSSLSELRDSGRC